MTVPYGVDLDRFAPAVDDRNARRALLGITGAPLVFTAGRLVRKKGFEYLIDAIRLLQATLPDVRLVIGGDGDLHEDLRRRADGLPVTLAGNLSQDQVGAWLSAADIIAVPSVRDDAGNVDGLPNFALEALASGTPVVATTAGGLPQAITDGGNGRLVPERDPSALAAALEGIWRSPDHGAALGATARDRVAHAHSWRTTAERMVEAYGTARAGRTASAID